MSQNIKPLKLSKNKNKTRKKLVPLIISGVVVLGGVGTLVLNLNGSLPSLCHAGGCEKKEIVLDLTQDQSDKNQKLELEKKKGQLNAPHSIFPMSDVELENNRLLLQRDIQRFISRSHDQIKPFNHSAEDWCILELKSLEHKTSKLLIKKCSNHVFRRAVKLALDSFDHNSLISKYNFKSYSPQIKVRLTK